jgi:hypothetical protein
MIRTRLELCNLKGGKEQGGEGGPGKGRSLPGFFRI